MTNGGVPTSNGIVSNVWVQVGGIYYYCRGATPTGEPRLAPLTEPPYGKTVHVYDGTDWHTEHVPFVLRRATLFWIVTGIVLTIVLSVGISHAHDPILFKFALPVAIVFCSLAAWSTQGALLTPHDDISYAEAQQANYEAYVESQHEAAERAAHKQAQAAQQFQAWAAASWAQQAAINQSLNPGQSTFPPYGQNPPL
jgi:hypothetical protein